MKIYAIADLHLSTNSSIDKPMDVFGDKWEEHPDRLQFAWNKLIKEDDLVIIPGDISWALKLEDAMPDIDWIHNMPGIKIISKGNHDLWWNRIQYLNTLHDDIVFLQNNCYYIKELNISICAIRGWPYPGSPEYSAHDEKIYKRELLRLRMGLDESIKKHPHATIIVAMHYPPTGASGRETVFTETLEEYGVKMCIYGHLHGKESWMRGIKGYCRDIDYKLVSLDYLGSVPKLIYDGELIYM